MTLVASQKAICRCEHMGVLGIVASQTWVRAEGAPLLVKGDFNGRPVAACMGGAEAVGVTRCTLVASVDDSKSHSAFLAIDGRGVALESAAGVTNWSQTLTASWSVATPGQGFISVKEA